MKYLFILGRNPELSEAELKYYFNPKIESKDKEILILETDKLPNIDELGGTIKIAKIISETKDLEEMEKNILSTELFAYSSNKPFFYITDYNPYYFEDIENIIKYYFKKNKFKAIYKKPKSKLKKTSPTELIKNNFPDNCTELIVYKHIIAKTIQVTNPFLLEQRDELRPCPDFLQSISLRLAKILINLTGIKQNQVLLDPFCGTGTLLQEALLRNINVIGIDKEKTMINKAERNLKWLKKNYKINNYHKLYTSLCKELSTFIPQNSIDAVATEPFMGPYFANYQKEEIIIKTINYLTQIYQSLFLELEKILKKDKRCVMIFPIFISNTNKKYYLDLRKILTKKFKIIDSIPYYKPGKMILLREVKLIKKIKL